MDIVTDLKARAKPWPRGNRFEDFAVGRVFRHHWGRTLTVADNTQFVTLTLHYNPLYTNADYARAHGHADLVVCPLLVFNTVFGLTVEDLSEGGGPFLGVDKLTYHRPVIVGETVYAESQVIAARETDSRPDYGIVTWHTKGFCEKGDLVIDFQRTNLVRKRK
ncbi:MaoC family dehydratase [Bradyrhizobium sp. INPA01-394B]|jgi:acyl dehydratase|uniref:MaoC family dehydratase n=1 Tax=Bradyrhizobium campsiandrae TaxID=1729892 RepID=A0ABR7UF71_9BRAD|nr:MaoC family dehydratase [Bradyrhizobium campsiandrae]MBC9882999.1 MaoC family dehydratase [Bradyrhizobium campsiandrae]MBC9982231.1 MaoC family dehydratase [Bradyrhizobium campsiandrae]